MRQFALSALLVMALAGCASTAPYGNFATEPPAGLEERIVADTVKQLVTLYPPARTRFHLGQPTPDAYGSALVEALRARGYALVEFKPGSRSGSRSGNCARAEPALRARRSGQSEPLPRHGDGGAEIAQPRLPGAERPRGAGRCLGSQGVTGDG
jgi:hypothetical protein